MANPKVIIENIPSLTGRRVQQLRKDAKREKKKSGITLQEALNLTAKEQGIAPTWQRLMTRGTELFSKLTGTPYETPLAKSTVFVGSTGGNLSRLATDQWRRAISFDRSVIDIFIDVHGDTLTYATVASKNQQFPSSRKLHVFSCYGEEGRLISNLYEAEPRTLRCLANTLFDDEEEQDAAVAYLQGGDDAPVHVIERMENSKQFGLLMWLDALSGEKGMPLNKAMGFSNTTLFLLPPVNKVNEKHRAFLSDILRLCLETVDFDKRASLPMRLTVTGLSGREPIPASLMTTLMTNPNIQVILQTEPCSDSEWLNAALLFAEQSYVSRISEWADVPACIKDTAARVTALPRRHDATPVIMFRERSLVDIDMSLACEPGYVADTIAPPTHRNGDPISAPTNTSTSTLPATHMLFCIPYVKGNMGPLPTFFALPLDGTDAVYTLSVETDLADKTPAEAEAWFRREISGQTRFERGPYPVSIFNHEMERFLGDYKTYTRLQQAYFGFGNTGCCIGEAHIMDESHHPRFQLQRG